LGIDEEERHQNDLLAIAEDMYITGIRIRNIPAPLDQEHMVQKMPPDTQTKEKQRVLLFPVVKPAVRAGEAAGVLGVRISLIFDTMRVLTPIKGVQKGKSIWEGEGKEVVNVETYALQHYERLGYKGYHCEGRIVTTLFGLLFWDIIFAPIPGAFETPYQTAPLDIFEDTFYHAREELIEQRLDEISRDNARQIIQNVDDEHRECGTWCLGVRWELFPKEDLLEIAEVSADCEEFFMWMTFRAVFQRRSLSLFVSSSMRRLCPAWIGGP
jgi:Fanconi-associated nuclease 1